MSQKNTDARFWAQVDVRAPDECWEWQGGKIDSGYGRLRYGSYPGKILAHRLAWKIHFGILPDDLCVCHRCDNPPCCNPMHLFLGTRCDNNRDRSAKGRTAEHRGSANPKARLSDDQVREIMGRWLDGETQVALGREFGVSQTTISRISVGKGWAHLWE